MNNKILSFLFFMLIKGMRTCGESKIALYNLRDGKLLMKPPKGGVV